MPPSPLDWTGLPPKLTVLKVPKVPKPPPGLPVPPAHAHHPRQTTPHHNAPPESPGTLNPTPARGQGRSLPPDRIRFDRSRPRHLRPRLRGGGSPQAASRRPRFAPLPRAELATPLGASDARGRGSGLYAASHGLRLGRAYRAPGRTRPAAAIARLARGDYLTKASMAAHSIGWHEVSAGPRRVAKFGRVRSRSVPCGRGRCSRPNLTLQKPNIMLRTS